MAARRGPRRLPGVGGRAALRHLLLAAIACSSCGCIIVPTSVASHRDDFGHKAIDAAALGLRPGVTTKAQSLDLVGAPTLTLASGHVLVYSWATRQEVRFVWGLMTTHHAGGREESIEGEQIHFLALEFDPGGVLRRKERRKGGRINMNATGVRDVFE